MDMLIDTNAYLGPYAFRRLSHNTPGELLRLMDHKGIDKAWVSSAAAVTYRNTQSANEDLAAAVKPHRDRLIPFAVLNPSYAGWLDDLKICRDDWGFQGLRLYPKWHGYELADAKGKDLLQRASDLGLLVSMPFRVEDFRQRSWLVDVPDLAIKDIEPLVKAFPRARFVFVNGTGFAGSSLGRTSAESPANYSIEISRLTAVIANEIGQLVGQLGADRIVFGSGMPFNYPDPALVKLEVLDVSAEDKEKIRWKNAERLLRV